LNGVINKLDKSLQLNENTYTTLFEKNITPEFVIDNNNSIIIKNEDIIKKLIKEKSIPYDGRIDLRIEAGVLKLAYTYNKLLSLSNSRTRILAHQVESTHRIINSLNQRFLLADEVGLGKTIEAGLVIKELIFRFDYRRILIICPASLVLQWQNELESKFNESFEIMDRQALKKYRKMQDNPWNACGRIICSLDFIKSISHKEDLTKTNWDVIVIDEAHRLRKDDLKTTLSYNVAELLSQNSKSFLLLTATPFRGKLEELYYLIRLVDKNLLGPFQTFYNTYCLKECDLSGLRQKISSAIIRRTKKEIGGFTKRHAKTIRFEFFPEERVLYDATTRYVIEEYNKAIQSENRAVGFVMTVFQKLLDSSSPALLSALKKRRDNLLYLVNHENEELIRNKLIEKNLIEFNDIDEPEDMDDMMEESVKKTRHDIQEEILILDNLISIAESVTRNKKAEKLREIVLKLKKGKCKKILIFTQFRTTQDYLKNILHDFKVELFNGSMDKDRKEEAIFNFKEDAEILISTEAGGEGRNLQFCNVLINYDLPWSPVKIEQRIGRIHRFGQANDVYIYNFSTKDTVAERILTVLIKKLKLFEESIGTPDILLGQIEEELNLNAIFMRMAASGNSRKIYSEIDGKLETARESYEKLNGLAIANKMDFNYDEYYKVTLRDREYSNKRIENFVNSLRDKSDLVDKYIGTKHKITRLYTIRELPDGTSPVKKGTFDSTRALDNENLEFLAFGNPIVDTLVDSCHEENFGGYSGIKVIKYQMELSGMIFYYLVYFNSIYKNRELVPVFIPAKNSFKDDEWEDIETRSLEMHPGIKFKINNYNSDITRIERNPDKYFQAASKRIIQKIDKITMNLNNNLDGSITSEIEKINDSYGKKIKEYEEQLDRQVCQMKWFNKDMRSAITRTKNNISKEISEKEGILSGYMNYQSVQYSIEMLSAGILIAVK
jgi:superfamily II DNA or RNA helicase